jgi:hypothetical protein
VEIGGGEFLHEAQRLPKRSVVLPGKPYHYVHSQAHIGTRGREPFLQRPDCVCAIRPEHFLEDVVVSALEREVKVATHGGMPGRKVYESLGQVLGFN